MDVCSGVFFRSSIEGTRISGWQAEIAPPGEHTGGIYESYGRGWLALPKPADEKVLRFGRWNRYTILVSGDWVVTTLNGHKIADISDEKIAAGQGFIALQIHEGGGIRIRWRKIRIKRLD